MLSRRTVQSVRKRSGAKTNNGFYDVKLSHRQHKTALFPSAASWVESKPTCHGPFSAPSPAAGWHVFNFSFRGRARASAVTGGSQWAQTESSPTRASWVVVSSGSFGAEPALFSETNCRRATSARFYRLVSTTLAGDAYYFGLGSFRNRTFPFGPGDAQPGGVPRAWLLDLKLFHRRISDLCFFL